MMTAAEAGPIAMAAIQAYVDQMGPVNQQDLGNALELLLSTVARTVEKYYGADAAQAVLMKTAGHLAHNPLPAETIQ